MVNQRRLRDPGAAITLAVPFTFAADSLGFEALSAQVLLALGAILVGYLVTIEIAKHYFY